MIEPKLPPLPCLVVGWQGPSKKLIHIFDNFVVIKEYVVVISKNKIKLGRK